MGNDGNILHIMWNNVTVNIWHVIKLRQKSFIMPLFS